MSDEDLRIHIEYIKESVREIKEKLDEKYVSKAEFEPVKRVVYALVLLALGGVLKMVVGV